MRISLRRVATVTKHVVFRLPVGERSIIKKGHTRCPQRVCLPHSDPSKLQLPVDKRTQLLGILKPNNAFFLLSSEKNSPHLFQIFSSPKQKLHPSTTEEREDHRTKEGKLGKRTPFATFWITATRIIAPSDGIGTVTIICRSVFFTARRNISSVKRSQKLSSPTNSCCRSQRKPNTGP